MGHVKILKKELELISDQYGHFGGEIGEDKVDLRQVCALWRELELI